MKMLMALLEDGKVVVYGGLSLLGESGQFTYVIGLLQIQEGSCKGWALSTAYENAILHRFHRIDSAVGRPKMDPIPNTIVYFVGESDERLVSKKASRQELLSVARFVKVFISDNGPPVGVDW